MSNAWAAVAAVAALLLPASSAAQADTTGAEPLTETPLPVVGAVTAQSAWGGKLSRFDEVLHGVWRIHGGTVAYWSVRHRPSEGDDHSLTSAAHELRGGVREPDVTSGLHRDVAHRAGNR